jgi:hypothetical protein
LFTFEKRAAGSPEALEVLKQELLNAANERGEIFREVSILKADEPLGYIPTSGRSFVISQSMSGAE